MVSDDASCVSSSCVSFDHIQNHYHVVNGAWKVQPKHTFMPFWSLDETHPRVVNVLSIQHLEIGGIVGMPENDHNYLEERKKQMRHTSPSYDDRIVMEPCHCCAVAERRRCCVQKAVDGSEIENEAKVKYENLTRKSVGAVTKLTHSNATSNERNQMLLRSLVSSFKAHSAR